MGIKIIICLLIGFNIQPILEVCLIPFDTKNQLTADGSRSRHQQILIKSYLHTFRTVDGDETPSKVLIKDI